MLLPILLSVIPILGGRSAEILPVGDMALLEESTLAVEGGVFTGAYSRMGFHHPGPFYFYLRYPLYLLSGWSHSSFYLTSALIAAISLVFSTVIIRRTSSYGNALIFTGLMSAFLFSISQSIWMSQWNPFVVIFPFILLATASAAAASGRPGLIWVAAAAASFVSQTHLGLLPSSLVLLVYTVVALSIGKKWKRSAVISSLAVIAALWAPVIYGELTSVHGRGNIQLILSSFTEGESSGATLHALSIWVQSVVPIESMILGSGMRNSFISPFRIMFILTAVRLILLSTALFLSWRRKTLFLFHIAAVTLILHITTLVSVFNVRGEIEQYLTTWMSVLSPLSWFAVAGCAVSCLSSSRWKKAGLNLLPIVAAVFALFSIRNQVLRNFSGDPLGYHSEAVELLLQQSWDLSLLNSSSQVLVEIQEDSLWPEMAGLALQLRKRGCIVSVQDEYLFMLHDFPQPFSPDKMLTLTGNGQFELTDPIDK